MYCFPIYLAWSDGTRYCDLIFRNVDRQTPSTQFTSLQIMGMNLSYTKAFWKLTSFKKKKKKRAQWEDVSYETGWGSLLEFNHASTSILGFPSFRMMRNKFLLFIKKKKELPSPRILNRNNHIWIPANYLTEVGHYFS